MNEPEIQRLYYAETASRYEAMHHGNNDEHFFALCYLVGILDFLRIKSILDIGSGTGRVIKYIKKCRPELRVIGIEPVAELREIGYSSGLSRGDLFAGDGTALQFDASSFDLVCEFGILHHVSTPEIVVAEMLRVAKQAIFISDSNNFGQGSLLVRTIKKSFNMLRL